MKNYKELYATYEESDLHRVVEEVTDAEREAQAMMDEIACRLDAETAARLDTVLGIVARAYEKQGYAYAENVRKARPRLRREAALKKLGGRARYFFRVICPVLRQPKIKSL